MASPREQGDGAPGHAALGVREVTGQGQSRDTGKPFSVSLEMDLAQLVLTLVAIATRTWNLALPWAAVFDELHFVKFAALYIKRIFFFDIHPPLGKLLLALAGSYSGFDGDVKLDRVGAEYPRSMPVREMRMVPAMLGSLVVPMVYEIAVELGLSRWAALFAGLYALLDNALLVQSRYMLMEGMLIFHQALAVLAFLKFRRLAHRQFSVKWWFWLCVCGLACTAATSIKYSGFFTVLLVMWHVARDQWKMLDDLSKTDTCLLKHALSRLLMLVVMPVCLYIGIFYVHLSRLTLAGPYDNIMSSAFQASLEGGLAALTKGQPLYVSYGSQVTLRQMQDVVAGRPCWLHSHVHMYPVRYPDQRGSSHQQQVTCYVFKDINNWWIIKHPDRDSLAVDDTPQPVKHGDIVQVIHGMSGRALNTHDVAAPVTPQNQEVSCYVDYNISMAAQNLWRVDIVNRESDGEKWQTIKSQIRLIHVNTSTAVRVTGKQLPEWGFHQLEVAADRVVQQPNTVWNVEEHRYTKGEGKESQAAEIRKSEMIPLEPTHLSFWSKFWELQTKMLLSTQDAELEHKYSSSPGEWPLTTRNIAYWMSDRSNAQIHLLGNPVVWYSSSLGVALYLLVLTFYLLRMRRQIYDISKDSWEQLVFVGEVVVVGYFFHYLPFFLAERTFFLYHYLPAVIFKFLALAAVLDHLASLAARVQGLQMAVVAVAVALVAGAVYAFLQLSVFSYGSTALSAEDIHRLVWCESWDFLVHVRK